MRSLKNKIKYFIGDDTIYIFKDIKNRILPSSSYIEDKHDNEKRERFYSKFISKDDLCFDVGANVGNRVTPLLNLGTKVVAFEPQSSCVNILKWKFGKKITIVPKAMGASETKAELHIANFSGLSSLSKDWINSVKNTRFTNFEWSNSEPIEVSTLDIAINTYGQPKFIKIDVEGYEPEVLRGLNTPVDLISFEYATPEQTKNVIECINLISKTNKNVEFNYSIGESMKLELDKWLSPQEMLLMVEKDEFTKTSFGDIYARTKKL